VVSLKLKVFLILPWMKTNSFGPSIFFFFVFFSQLVCVIDWVLLYLLNISTNRCTLLLQSIIGLQRGVYILRNRQRCIRRTHFKCKKLRVVMDLNGWGRGVKCVWK
jgi:hypothetical protein